jgi:hypothetical protein
MIILVCVQQAQATLPTAVINGPTSAPAPGIVILDSTGSAGDANPLWLVSDADDVVQAMEGKDGRLALFYMNPKPTTAKVVLIMFGTGTDAQSRAYAKRAIAFGGGPAPVPPGPTPVPPVPPTPVPPSPPSPVGPDLPDGRFKLAAVAYNAAMQVPLPPRSRSPAVGDAFGSVASAINAKTLAGRAAIGQATKNQLSQAMGTDAAAWGTAKTAVVGAFNGLEAQGVIATDADIAVAYLEMQTGFSQAK